MDKVFDHRLEAYAEIMIRVGLNLRPGQRLLLQAPIEAAPLVRLIASKAYDAGARLVDVIWDDSQLTLIRYQHAPRDSFDEFPTWVATALENNFKDGGARLGLRAADPDLLKDQDPVLVGIAQKSTMQHTMAAMNLLTRNTSNWLVVSMPIPVWATKVFPDKTPDEAVDQLWKAIFSVCRLDQPDPVSAWKQHVEKLKSRKDYLNAKHYARLHFTGPGTDLTIGLPAGHIWLGGQITSQNGIDFIPNMPTEEVFTMPHRQLVNGTVCASRPLSYAGTLIENFSMTFKDGQVVDFNAEKGKDTLRELLSVDEGSRRLGEVALVPHSSPISQSGILFYNTLFDENAACHIALGKAYQMTMKNGETMADEIFMNQGGNVSLAHVDFMIGSGQTNLDGILANGAREPIMRSGEWVDS